MTLEIRRNTMEFDLLGGLRLRQFASLYWQSNGLRKLGFATTESWSTAWYARARKGLRPIEGTGSVEPAQAWGRYLDAPQ